MSVGIKSLTLVPHVGSSLKQWYAHGELPWVFTLKETNRHFNTLCSGRQFQSVFHKRKQWQFIRTVLQIKQNQIHIETYLNFKTYCLVSSFPWTHWELLFLVFHVSVSLHRRQWERLGMYCWDLGTNVLFSKLAEVLTRLGQLRESMAMKRTFPSQYLPRCALSLMWDWGQINNTGSSQGKSGTT